MTETGDRRVRFDFEIDFANGGGLQGQGFRLDIDGEDIDDDALAAYIVRDLRLLMVAEARILNKTIIRERHKRAATAASSGRTHIDLGRPVTSPLGDDLDALPLDRLVDLDAVCIDVTGTESPALGRLLLAPYDVAGRAVLLHTGWERDRGADPYLTERAARHLAEEGAALVGIDAPGLGEAASVLRAAGIPICERLTGLDALPVDGFRFSAVPVVVDGTFAVRAYASVA